VLLALAWIVPVLLGFAALGAMVDRNARARAGASACIAAAIPLGIGLCSIVYFAAAFTLGPELWKTTAVEVVVLAAVACLAKRRRRTAPPIPAPDVAARAPWWLRAAVVAGLCGAAASFVTQARDLPFGDADGIAIWGNRAIFLKRAFWDWPLVFSPELVHTDYPLLVPLSLLRAWQYTGDETPLAGVLLALVFGACTLLALGSAVARVRGATTGALATLGLCATPFFAVHAAGQCGDVPVSCYAVLAAASLRLAGERGAILAGAFASLAAWTKNEGAVLAAALLLWVAMRQLRRGGGVAAALRFGARYLLGGLPAIAAIAVFKGWLASPNDLFDNHDAGRVVPMLTSPDRWRAVAAAFAELSVWFRGAGAVAGLGPFLLALLVVAVWRPAPRRFLSVELATAATFSAVVFVVFLLSPYDQRWHLGTALDRLLLQVWPLTLLGAALAAGDVDPSAVDPSAVDPSAVDPAAVEATTARSDRPHQQDG
jgi:hypothetical protein